MKNLTVILPVDDLNKYSNYVNFNVQIFKKLKIKTLIISDKKEINKFKSKLVNTICSKKFKSAIDKFSVGLKRLKTEYMFLLREDVLIHEYGFKKILKKMLLHKNLVSVSGLQFIALSKNYNFIFPHNPRTVRFNYDRIKHKDIKWKIHNVLRDSPEIYWTFHKTKIVKNYWNRLYLKDKYFNDKNLSEYFLIFYFLSYGDISFEPIPINLKIKNKKINKKIYSFHYHKKNYGYNRDINKLCSIFKKNRKLSIIKTKEFLEESIKIRSYNPKPRNLLESYNFLGKKIIVMKKIFLKFFHIIFYNKTIISQHDKYFMSSLEKKYYRKIINDKNYNNGFKKMMSNLVS